MSQRKTSEERIDSLDARIAQLLAQKEQEQARLDEAAGMAFRQTFVTRIALLEEKKGALGRFDTADRRSLQEEIEGLKSRVAKIESSISVPMTEISKQREAIRKRLVSVNKTLETAGLW